MIRTLEFLTTKDNSLLIKYDLINQMIQYPNKILYNSLSLNGISRNSLKRVGVCLCDKNYHGFKCDFKLSQKDNLANNCERKKNISCNRETSICKSSAFKLSNIFSPKEAKESIYESYYCECTANNSIGLNCEYKKSQCDFNTLNDSFKTVRSIFNSTKKCNALKNEFCYPLLNNSTRKTNNTDYNCLNESIDNEQVINYLIFDEQQIKTDQNDSQSKLDLNDSSVLIALQNFIKDVTFKHYIYNDYIKLPKGPLALLSNSITLKPIFNEVLLKLNKLIQKNENKDELIKDLMLNRSQQLFSNTSDRNLVKDIKKILSMNLTFGLNNIELSMLNGDPNYLVNSLDELKSKSQNLDALKTDLIDLFSLNINNESYLNYFDLSKKNIEILKIDILPGIYIDANDNLLIRPTPGLFYRYLSRDLKKSHGNELIFLPGIFNPTTDLNQQANAIFSPGIMSLPIDDVGIKNLQKDENHYLNKFKQIQIPFNLNIFNKSSLILTPIDSKSNYEKLFSKQLSNGEFYKLINDQKKLSARTILSTVILTNPTMTNSENIEIRSKLRNKDKTKTYIPKGAQFYSKIKTENAFIQPFIFYDTYGDPIPRSIIQKWLEKFCKNYKGISIKY